MINAITAEYPIILTVEDLASDFRAFVSSFQKKGIQDKGWMESAQKKCLELNARFAQLQKYWGDKRQSFREMMEQTRGSLLTAAQELADSRSENSNTKKWAQLQESMVRHYEDFISGLRTSKFWPKDAKPKVRSLRVPRVARSLVHIFLGTSAVLLYELVLTKSLAMILLFSVLAVFAGLEISRRFSSRFNDFMIDKLFGLISRPQERYRINSASYYLLAMTLVATLLPKPAACAAVLVLAWGDPIASMVGSRFGRLRLLNDKSLLGSGTFFGVSFLVVFCYFLLFATGYSVLVFLTLAVFVALVGTAVELFSQKIDDNLTIPLVCASCLWLWF